MIEKLAQTVAELPPGIIKAKTSTEDAASADDHLFRQALFKKVKTTSGNAVPAIDAFFDNLTATSVRGDVDAARALRRIIHHRQQQDGAAAAQSKRENSPIAAALLRQKRLADVAHLVGGLAFLAMLPALKEQAEAAYRPFQLRSSMVPFGLDLGPACEAIAKHARRERKRRPKGDYEVGYGKPPLQTRFTAENNPARRRKAASAWDALDCSLHKPVTLTRSNGDKTSTTRLRAAYDSLIRKAITGDRAARTEVLRRILDLSRKGLLSAPPCPHRVRHRQVSEEDRQCLSEGLAFTTHHVSREIIALFAKNFGADPGIVDHEYDALVAKARRSETRQAAQRHTADPGGRSTGGRAAEPAPAPKTNESGGSAPAPPTRTRTRAASPANPKHPTLPRARVPVVETPATSKTAHSIPGGKPRG